MANIIKIKRKTTTGAPSLGQLDIGEGCIVVPDETLYFKKDASTIIGPFTAGAGGGGGSTTFITIEANLGNQPRLSGQFNITGTGFSVGRPVLITQAMGPYTGKGTLADEAADQCLATAVVINSTTIKCIWAAVGSPLKGNVKFNYTIL